MSPNKDETGRRIVSDAVVVDLAVKFIVYIRWHKTSQLVDDGRNKYWLINFNKIILIEKFSMTLII